MKIGLCASTRWGPGNWQLHWRFIRAVSIDYQSKTQRRVYSYAASALQRGGGVESFSLGG